MPRGVRALLHGRQDCCGRPAAWKSVVECQLMNWRTGELAYRGMAGWVAGVNSRVFFAVRLPVPPHPGFGRCLSLGSRDGAVQQAFSKDKKKPQIAPWLLEV